MKFWMLKLFTILANVRLKSEYGLDWEEKLIHFLKKMFIW